jgi:predicted nucleotidyltransferase
VKRDAKRTVAVDLPPDSAELIRQWAARTNAVQEVWLFGSRAKGTSRPDSDVDIGIYLMPHEWAFGIYVAKRRCLAAGAGGIARDAG